MNDTVLFYWFLWLFFIIIYFFLDKSNVRLFLIVWVLLMIVFRLYAFEAIFSVNLSYSFIILFVGSFLFFSIYSYSVYEYAFTFTLMIGYMALLIWEKVTPIWFFISSPFVIAIIVGLLAFYFIEPISKQIAIVIFSMTIGYTLVHITLLSYNWKIIKLEDPLYHMLSISIIFLLSIFVLKRLVLYINKRMT